MGHEFEAVDKAEVPATPEQVWEAIATGPGIDSWFMGRTEISGDTVSLHYDGMTFASAVTERAPLERFAHAADPAPDGRFIAYDFMIEGRAGGATALRLVTSGFLPGDDWADEFDAMTKGGALFFRTLVTYLTHFAGRTAAPITVSGRPAGDMAATWQALYAELGLSGRPAEGDQARLVVGGRALDAVVFHVNDKNLSVRAENGMYRFLEGFFQKTIITGHLVFPPDQPQPDDVWQAWLARVII